MSTQSGAGTLHKLGKDGKKLRVDTSGKGKTEFLCISCKKPRRIERKNDKICLDKMPNGAYRLHGKQDCNICSRMHNVSLFVSKKLGEELAKDIPECRQKTIIRKKKTPKSTGLLGLGFLGL